MADNENTQTQQDTQGAGQEHGQEHEQAQGQERDEATETSDVAALRREAGSRRRQLREVEKERDALASRVDQHDRREVERLVSDGLADPSDLWSAVDLDALREDGAITEEKVSEALAGLLEAKPHYRKPRDHPDLHQGARQEVAEPPSFGRALKGGR